MNESQERREELLRMSRQKWRKGSIPAVHPRYQHVYRGLYGEHSSEENGGSSFFARMFISFLIFGMFVAADYTGEKIWKYTPSQIVSQIEYQPDIMTGNWEEKILRRYLIKSRIKALPVFGRHFSFFAYCILHFGQRENIIIQSEGLTNLHIRI